MKVMIRWIILATILSIIAGFFINHHVRLGRYATHLKQKYGLHNDEIQLLAYERKHTVRISAGLFSSTKRVIPPILTYDVNGKLVKVVDHDKGIIDDYQMEEVGYIAADFFTEMLGLSVEYVELGCTYEGGYSDGIDDTLSEFIRVHNAFIQPDHMKFFLLEFGKKHHEGVISNISCATVTIYVNLENSDNLYTIIDDIDSKLMPFIQNINPDRFTIWLYEGGHDRIELVKDSLRNDNNYPDDFNTYHVRSLDNIKACIFYVDPNGNSRNPNFEKIGNFHIDNTGLWLTGR